VRERQRADDEVDRVVVERQLVEVGLVEFRCRYLLACDRERLRRCVGSDDRVAE
jgi:hypothetical protein